MNRTGGHLRIRLDRDDEDLKIVEIKRVEEILRSKGCGGPCTVISTWETARVVTRYTSGAVLSRRDTRLDEDFDCVRFARSNVRHYCRKTTHQNPTADFGGQEARLEPDSTC